MQTLASGFDNLDIPNFRGNCKKKIRFKLIANKATIVSVAENFESYKS